MVNIINDLPSFANVDVKEIEAKINTVLKNNILIFKELKNKIGKRVESFDDVIRPFEHLNLELENLWSPFRHLHGVADTKELRETYERLEQQIVDY